MTRTLAARLLAAIMLPAMFMALPTRAAECKLSRVTAMDVIIHPSAGILMPVRIGEHDVWMALQMSSGLAMISPTAAENLGLKSGHVRTDVNLRSNGLPIEREVSIPSLVIGGANFAGWKLYVQPGPPRPLQMYQGRPMIGAVSARFMNAVDLELDFAGAKLNLFKHARCRGGQVYWSPDFTMEYLYADPSGLLYFPMELDGKRIETSLNTQGPRSRLSESVAKRYFSFRRDARAPQQGGPPGQFVGMRVLGLTARQIAMPDLPVYIIDDTQRRCELGEKERGSNAIGFRNCFGVAPFELGMDALRNFRIYIASEEQRIYFTRNAARGAPAAAGAASAAAAAPPTVAPADADAAAAAPADAPAAPDEPPTR